MTARTQALGAMIVASVLWSTAGVTAKLLLRVFDPFSLAFFRFLIASIIILPFAYRSIPLTRQSIRDLLPVSLMSSLNIALFYLALTRTTANAATAIYTAEPLLVVLLAKFFLGELSTPRRITGIVVGGIGVLTILLLPVVGRGEQITGDVLGNGIVLLAAISFAFYTIGSRHLTKKYSPLAMTFASTVTTCGVFFILTVLTAPASLKIVMETTPYTLLLLLYLGVGVTVVTYFLYQWSLQRVSATAVSLTTYLQPVFAFIINAVVLGEQLTAAFFFGTALVLVGVSLATGSSLKRVYTQIRGVI